MNGFPKSPGVDNFCELFHTIFSDFRKPVLAVISSFQKAFHDSTSSFLNPFKLKGIELGNTSGLRENSYN
jgi:hypothetical protein